MMVFLAPISVSPLIDDGVAVLERRRSGKLFDAIGGQELFDPAGELGDDLVLALGHRGVVDLGAADGDAELFRVTDVGESLGGSDERLGRDAAEVQARPAVAFPFDDSDGGAELRGADGGGIAAGAGADDYDVILVHSPLSSSFDLMLLMKRAAMAPSTRRWSDDSVIFMMGRTTIASPRTTGFLIVLDTARIADSPGLMMAVKFSTSSMPMLEMVNGRSAHVVGAEATGARLFDERLRALAQFGKRQRVGVANNRDNQALVEVHRDAEMHPAIPAHAPAVGRAVDGGVFLQRQDGGAGDEVGDGIAGAAGIEAGANRDDLGHVDFDGDVEVRRGDHAMGETLGDDLAHLAHRLRLLGDRPLDVGDFEALRSVFRPQGDEVEVFLGRQRLGGRADAQVLIVVGLEIGLDVTLDDAAFRTAA